MSEQGEFDSSMMTGFLISVVEWVGDTFDPEDVFGKDRLLIYMQNFYNPEDIFTEAHLRDWAREAGYEDL